MLTTAQLRSLILSVGSSNVSLLLNWEWKRLTTRMKKRLSSSCRSTRWGGEVRFSKYWHLAHPTWSSVWLKSGGDYNESIIRKCFPHVMFIWVFVSALIRLTAMASRSTWKVEEADMPAINPALFSLAMSCKFVQLTRLLNSTAWKWVFPRTCGKEPLQIEDSPLFSCMWRSPAGFSGPGSCPRWTPSTGWCPVGASDLEILSFAKPLDWYGVFIMLMQYL